MNNLSVADTLIMIRDHYYKFDRADYKPDEDPELMEIIGGDQISIGIISSTQNVIYKFNSGELTIHKYPRRRYLNV